VIQCRFWPATITTSLAVSTCPVAKGWQHDGQNAPVRGWALEQYIGATARALPSGGVQGHAVVSVWRLYYGPTNVGPIASTIVSSLGSVEVL